MEVHHGVNLVDVRGVLPELSDIGLAILEPQILRGFVERLPKVELHRHFEGAITVDSLLSIAEREGVELPSRERDELEKLVTITPDDHSLIDFINKFSVIGQVFASAKVVEELAYNCVTDAAAENIKYLELRYSPSYIVEAHKLDMDEVTAAVQRGIKAAAADTGILVRSILIVERQRSMEEAWQVERLAEKYMSDGVVALDLANDEANYGPKPFRDVFAAAKQKGLAITVHAGEAAGPENIRDAVEILGAMRIGHGVTAIQDSEVMRMLHSLRIPLELCPTSNVQTEAVMQLAEHPLSLFYDAGLQIVLNTDDPAVCGIDLNDEYCSVISQFDFSLYGVERLLVNGVMSCFLPPPERRALMQKIGSEYQEAKGWLLNQFPVLDKGIV
jgi:adenosine deaminase